MMILDWFSELNVRGFGAEAYYFENEPPDVPLIQLLQLDEKDLKAFSRELLELDVLPEYLKASMSELRWGIRAYSQFQDILPITFTLDSAMHEIANRHYCYYESLVYLRESIVSWLDKNVLAALTILRPFLELSVLHVYWYLQCEGKDYRRYYDWLKSDRDKGKPKFRQALTYVFDSVPTRGWVEDSRIDELQKVIGNLYTALCVYNHTPRIHESITAQGQGLGNIAYESFLFALHIINLLLRQLVYLFILTYPMSMFPVDGFEKWGFTGPVGLFFDRCSFAILEAYLKPEDVASLKESLSSVPEVESRLKWFDELPTLTKDEIEADWQELSQGSPARRGASHIGERLAMSKAKFRALGWFLNYMMEPEGEDDISIEAYEWQMQRLKKW